jgi:hypothetical protein
VKGKNKKKRKMEINCPNGNIDKKVTGTRVRSIEAAKRLE